VQAAVEIYGLMVTSGNFPGRFLERRSTEQLILDTGSIFALPDTIFGLESVVRPANEPGQE
jgi:hypothetical protein